MNNLEAFILSISLLIIISIIIAKISKNVGVPVLLLFIGVGMLAGSEGPGGIKFSNAGLAQSIGIFSLVLILFSGGLDTKWKKAEPVFISSFSLATLGVLITTLIVGIFVHFVFHLPYLISFLLGAVISSTDVSAVISILRFRNLNLKGNVKPLLELESGTNDPMAVFLTIGLIELITIPEASFLSLIGLFILQISLGFVFGAGAGKLIVILINKLRFPIEGFNSVFVLAFAFLTYSVTSVLHGSGFLAVYVCGVIISNNEIVFKKTIFRFFDALAWLAQIGMFITLGLLVFPSHLMTVIPAGLAISAFLILVARPVSVFIALARSKFNIPEKILISWVGLRGAVPIILATFPLLAGVKQAEWIFDVIFFIVLTSALFQGWTIPSVAKLLNLDVPSEEHNESPVELGHVQNNQIKMINLTVPEKGIALTKPIVQISQLKDVVIVTVRRDGQYFVPTGGTVLHPGDVLQLLVDRNKILPVLDFFKSEKQNQSQEK